MDYETTDPKIAQVNEMIENFIMKQRIRLLERLISTMTQIIRTTGTTHAQLCQDAIADITVMKNIICDMYELAMKQIEKQAHYSVYGK